jgi:hypothetical protein
MCSVQHIQPGEFSAMKCFLKGITLLGATGVLALSTQAQAQYLLIDDFTTVQSETGVVDGAGILGGERDISVSGDHSLSIGSGTAQAKRSAGVDPGFAVFFWDGDDNTTTVSLDLGPVDLTDGGQNDRFYFDVQEIFGTANLAVQVYTTNSDFSQVVVNISQPGPYQLLFSDIDMAPINPADFTSVGRLAFRIIMGAGENITLGPFIAGPDPLLFEDGFETEAD